MSPSPTALESTRYVVHQAVLNQQPGNGEQWSDRAIQEAAWGFAGQAPSGTIRVTSCYLEKLVSITGLLPFECGGGGSYIL
jgi:hypothetical protein